MILLESGPAKTDRNYWLFVGVAFIAFALYFVYDGAYGYRNKNLQRARTELLRYVDQPPAGLDTDETPTKADFERLIGMKPPLTREQVLAVLGDSTEPKPGSLPAGTQLFISAYGMATVTFTPDGYVDLRHLNWQTWFKTHDEIVAQYYWALLPALLAIYFFYRAYKAATLRAVIDEEGMTYGGVRIPFADMVSLRDYNRKGWVDLYYRDGEQEKRLRIDNQKIAEFDRIIELLCEKKGFENPVKAAEETAQRDEAEAGPEAEASSSATGEEAIARNGSASEQASDKQD